MSVNWGKNKKYLVPCLTFKIIVFDNANRKTIQRQFLLFQKKKGFHASELASYPGDANSNQA